MKDEARDSQRFNLSLLLVSGAQHATAQISETLEHWFRFLCEVFVLWTYAVYRMTHSRRKIWDFEFNLMRSVPIPRWV